MKDVLIALVIALLAFEFIEHVVLPLIWYVKDRKKRSVSGAAGMIGRVGKITHWEGTEGKILVHGELWQAVSDAPLSVGDRAVVQDVKGLTLHVKHFKD